MNTCDEDTKNFEAVLAAHGLENAAEAATAIDDAARDILGFIPKRGSAPTAWDLTLEERRLSMNDKRRVLEDALTASNPFRSLGDYSELRASVNQNVKIHYLLRRPITDGRIGSISRKNWGDLAPWVKLRVRFAIRRMLARLRKNIRPGARPKAARADFIYCIAEIYIRQRGLQIELEDQPDPADSKDVDFHCRKRLITVEELPVSKDSRYVAFLAAVLPRYIPATEATEAAISDHLQRERAKRKGQDGSLVS